MHRPSPRRPTAPTHHRLLAALSTTVLALTVFAVAPTTPQPAAAATVGSAIRHLWSTSRTTAAARSVTVARPSVAVGDVLVARVANRGAVSASLTAKGWTRVGSTRSASLLQATVLTRVVGAKEPSRYTFATSVASPLLVTVTAFRGVDRSRPVEQFAGQVNGNAATLSTPALTTGSGNDVALWFSTQLASGSCGVLTVPSGFSAVRSVCAAGTVQLSGSTGVQQLGAPATRAGWTGRSTAAATNVTQVVALRPAATVQAAARYASRSVDVGPLWKGRTTAGQKITSLADATLHEPSGLAASWVNKGVMYAHSEASVHGMVALRTSTAQVVGSYQVAIPRQFDWEDAAVGPCPAGSCLFAGDIGRVKNGAKAPSTFAVYRVPEPNLAKGKVSGTLRGDWFRFRYPDGAHNAEALMVHPRSGRIYVITKEKSGRSGVYAFPAKLPKPSSTRVTRLTKLATLSVPRWTGSPANTAAATWYAQVTAASIHPAGDRFLLRTPFRVYEYRATKGKAFATAFKARPVRLANPSSESQGEAIEYARDGSAYFTLGERTRPPFILKRIDRR